MNATRQMSIPKLRFLITLERSLRNCQEQINLFLKTLLMTLNYYRAVKKVQAITQNKSEAISRFDRPLVFGMRRHEWFEGVARIISLSR
jgi:hypothetical protein